MKIATVRQPCGAEPALLGAPRGGAGGVDRGAGDVPEVSRSGRSVAILGETREHSPDLPGMAGCLRRACPALHHGRDRSYRLRVAGGLERLVGLAAAVVARVRDSRHPHPLVCPVLRARCGPARQTCEVRSLERRGIKLIRA